MQRLFLVRHGQTDPNKHQIIQGGGVNSDLNDEGRRQARLFFQRYGNHPFVGYYVSGLRRTAQTMEPFMRKGAVFVRDPRLDEMNWGVLEGVLPGPREIEIFHDANRRWENGELDYAIAGAESPRAVQRRALAAVEDILRRHPAGDVLICTHGRVLRILLATLTGAGLENMNRFLHQNAALNVLTRRENGFFAERLNDVEHLRQELSPAP
ncbi:MAG: histidine phosphatase family protein [Bacteroidia bacterium]|nr:histidine phosphatase family protein [Bacteroidia bacterium]MDW8334343.1 histidine phosphatase family protein [Bacteroidia bacterium]